MEEAMSYTLQQLAGDIRKTLEADPGREGRQALRPFVIRALKDPEFVAENLKDRPEGGNPREVLYEDDKLGFCICGHVYVPDATGNPHDHGESWAIYGQATGITEMTDWRVVEPGDDKKPTLVVPERVYNMNPGDAHFYDIGDIHSPRRMMPSRLIRIEGANLDHVRRTRIKAKVTA